jgi:hypothetical protein
VNLTYLGDALDHWKGSLLEFLQERHALRNFAVDAMASDLTSWTANDCEVFLRLMRITSSELIRHNASLENRAAYFREILHVGDLFLDPDTGFATGPVKDRRCYIFPSEVGGLLDVSDGRLLAIYQHVRAQRVTRRVDRVLEILRGSIGHFGWCSYESASVAMLFVSRAATRTLCVADCFKSLLGRHAAGRIRDSATPRNQKL